MHSLPHTYPCLDFLSHKQRKSSSLLSSDTSKRPDVRLVGKVTCLGAYLLGRLTAKNGRVGEEEEEEDRGFYGWPTTGVPFVSMSSLHCPSIPPPGSSNCLRAGWIFHKQAIIGRMWRKKWVTLSADGTLIVANQITSKRRGRQAYNLRRDCMFMRTAGQCQHLLPPLEVEDKTSLIELLLTGERRLAFCGVSSEDTELWIKCIETSRLDIDRGPTPAPATIVSSTLAALDDDPEEKTVSCCMCVKRSSKVKAIDYRPSTKQSSNSSMRRRRRVSWSKHVIMIDE